MRIAIVNDLASVRELLRRIVVEVAGHEVAWLARDGEEAVERAAEDVPDLILMDLIMPKMDGVEAIRLIMESHPCAILAVTASISSNLDKVYEAMGHGALDAIDTPTLASRDHYQGAEALLDKIISVERLLGAPCRVATGLTGLNTRPLALIGSSTGGPKALQEIVSNWPAEAPCLVIAQHVDPAFAQGLSKWLSEAAERPVDLIDPGMEPEPSRILVARTDRHLVLDEDGRLNYQDEPHNSFYHPSIDVFFKSVSRRWSTPGVATILTGMGHDGAEGLWALKQAGWHTFAQDRDSCVVWGMPKAAVELGAVDQELPPIALAEAMIQNVAGSRSDYV